MSGLLHKKGGAAVVTPWGCSIFLVQERRDTHAALDFGRRIEQRWLYYFLLRRGGTHMGDSISAGA